MDKAEDEADAKNMPGIILEDSEFESCDQAAFKGSQTLSEGRVCGGG